LVPRKLLLRLTPEVEVPATKISSPGSTTLSAMLKLLHDELSVKQSAAELPLVKSM